MSKCIYCEIELNFKTKGEPNSASEEHIIPLSIGGSNGFTTLDVCKRSNNDLGSSVDAPFSNTLPIAIKRHELKIKSSSGKIPPIVWHGHSDDGIPGKMTIHSDGTGDIAFEPSVVRNNIGNVEVISVGAPEEIFNTIIAGKINKMNKSNGTLRSMSGEQLTTLDDVFSVAEEKLIDRINFKIAYFEQEAWTRGILKIALGIGHKILGEEWSFGHEASKIRQIVINSIDNWKTDPSGQISCELDRKLRLPLGKTVQVRDASLHTVGILPGPDGNGIMAISLFGGNNVPESVIFAGKLPDRFLRALNEKSCANMVMGYRNDPRNRTTTPITFGEIDRRIAAQGPTDRKLMRLYASKTSK